MKFEFLVQIFLLAHLRTSLLYPSEALHIVSFAKLKKTDPDSLPEYHYLAKFGIGK